MVEVSAVLLMMSPNRGMAFGANIKGIYLSAQCGVALQEISN
jgi:hypothetical protein